MYAKYTRIFRTPKETSKIHQILAVLGNDIIYQILAVLGNDDIHQNSDFLGEHQKTINPAFLWRDLFMSLRGVALQQRENPAEANLILISCPFREIATSLRSSQ